MCTHTLVFMKNKNFIAIGTILLLSVLWPERHSRAGRTPLKLKVDVFWHNSDAHNICPSHSRMRPQACPLIPDLGGRSFLTGGRSKKSSSDVGTRILENRLNKNRPSVLHYGTSSSMLELHRYLWFGYRAEI